MKITQIFTHPTLTALRLARCYIEKDCNNEKSKECLRLIDIEINNINSYFREKQPLKHPEFNPSELNR